MLGEAPPFATLFGDITDGRKELASAPPCGGREKTGMLLRKALFNRLAHDRRRVSEAA
jgi:hypothetical protein